MARGLLRHATRRLSVERHMRVHSWRSTASPTASELHTQLGATGQLRAAHDNNPNLQQSSADTSTVGTPLYDTVNLGRRDAATRTRRWGPRRGILRRGPPTTDDARAVQARPVRTQLGRFWRLAGADGRYVQARLLRGGCWQRRLCRGQHLAWLQPRVHRHRRAAGAAADVFGRGVGGRGVGDDAGGAASVGEAATARHARRRQHRARRAGTATLGAQAGAASGTAARRAGTAMLGAQAGTAAASGTAPSPAAGHHRRHPPRGAPFLEETEARLIQKQRAADEHISWRYEQFECSHGCRHHNDPRIPAAAAARGAATVALAPFCSPLSPLLLVNPPLLQNEAPLLGATARRRCAARCWRRAVAAQHARGVAAARACCAARHAAAASASRNARAHVCICATWGARGSVLLGAWLGRRRAAHRGLEWF